MLGAVATGSSLDAVSVGAKRRRRECIGGMAELSWRRVHAGVSVGLGMGGGAGLGCLGDGVEWTGEACEKEDCAVSSLE